MTPLTFLVLTFAGWLDSHRDQAIEYLKAENLFLRQHLAPGRNLPTDAERRRLARAAKALSRQQLRDIGPFFSPDTLIRWYRKLICRKYDGSAKRGPGRPGPPATINELVIRFATENPSWGYTRVRGALLNLGHDLSTSTIARILRNAGIPPAPTRGKKLTWKQFLAAHWEGLAATDFFQVEALTPVGLVRYSVLFVIRLQTREVTILGVAHDPGADWVRTVTRGALDVIDGCLHDVTHLICDRDPLFGPAFEGILELGDVERVQLPARSPNLNAYAERFIGSIRRECLSKIIPLGRRHLERTIREYVRHYNSERNHQGLGNRLIDPSPCAANGDGPIECRDRLGGLLRYYHRGAA